MGIVSHQQRRGRDSLRRTAGLLVGGLVAIAAVIAVQPATAEAPAAAETPWLTVSDDRFATFSIPEAEIQARMGQVSQVVAEGNFGPSSNWAEFGLSRRGGAFTGVIGPLEPGLYYYQITGDDTKVVKDPTNPTTVESEPEWSTFFVPGESARLLADVPENRGGDLDTLTYWSRVEKEERSALVWTPPTYKAQRAKPYPVFYLQHGGGQSYRDWAEVGRAKQILDNLYLDGDLKPMVVVMGNGNVSNFQEELLNNLVPAVYDDYNISRDPAQQALAGLSMGGFQTLSTLLDRPSEFAYVGSFAGLLREDVSRADAKAINEGTKLVRLYTGNVTDLAYNANYEILEKFDKAGVDYEFDGVNPDAGHNWNAWQENLIDFAPRLFRHAPNHGPSPGHLPLDSEFSPPPAGTTPTPWLSEDANGDVFVTFETTTEFQDAEHVTVWANVAPGGSWLRTELSPSGDRWRGTIGPFKPGFYHYRLIVDLTAVKDTSNPTSVTSEPTWSTFFVPGESARLLADVPEGQGGTVEELTYDSDVAGEERTSYVWTPPGYDPDRTEPYPVFYLQHGGGQSYTDWIEMGRAKQILDNHSIDGNIEPMVVVMSNGNVDDFTTELLDNIVPAAQAAYNISDDPSQRALAGLSMGGGQTYGVLTSHPGEFAYVASFSAGFGDRENVDVEAINDGTELLRVYTGDPTDFAYNGVMDSLATFDELGIEYEFDGPTPGPHGWDTWQKNLIDFAPQLFDDRA